jgi:hypothetical protein
MGGNLSQFPRRTVAASIEDLTIFQEYWSECKSTASADKGLPYPDNLESWRALICGLRLTEPR